MAFFGLHLCCLRGKYAQFVMVCIFCFLRIFAAVKQRKGMTKCEEAPLNNSATSAEDAAAAQKKERSMAIVLIAIVVMFIVCQSIKVTS